MWGLDLDCETWIFQICYQCSTEEGKCISMDCPVFHKLFKYERDLPLRLQMIEQLKKLEW